MSMSATGLAPRPRDLPSRGAGSAAPRGEHSVRQRIPRWLLALGAASFAAYLSAALVMVYGMGYEIGDAVSRTADARAMLFSHDPHLAAMGFVWLPLPVLAQLPAMLVLSPFHQAIFAGPLTTSLCAAMTVVIVGLIGVDLGLPRWLTIAITAAYSFNPVVIFTGANGMSESWFWFGAAVAFLGLFRWLGNRISTNLALTAIGCGIATLVRYESLVFVPLVAFIAATNRTSQVESGRASPRRLRSLSSRIGIFVAVALPSLHLFLIWLAGELIIERDPLYWAKVQARSGRTPVGAQWLPRILTSSSLTHWTVVHVAVITPGCLLLVPFLVFVTLRHSRVALVGGSLLAGCWLFPVLLLIQLLRRVTSGDPRYLEPSVLFITLTAAWLGSVLAWEPRRVRVLGRLALVGVLVLGGITATFALSNPNLAYTEQVNRFYDVLLGRPLPHITAAEPAPIIETWSRIAADIDRRLQGRSRVLIDDNVAFPAFVLTRHPGRYLISPDRGYQRALADPVGRFDYLLYQPGSPLAPSIEGIIQDSTGGRWQAVATYTDAHTNATVATLYHVVP